MGKSVHELTAPEDRARTRTLNEDMRQGRVNLFEGQQGLAKAKEFMPEVVGATSGSRGWTVTR